LDTSLGTQARISDAAYEAVPAQLLPFLRPDSVGLVRQSGDTLQVQFSGIDGVAYAVQSSSNLEDWSTLGTNYPVFGVLSFADTLSPGVACRFYRSILLP